ncbi:MAG: metal ABC transporter ATP-binding protein [Candidatus Sericytochromatia bacterium]|nr:metal ABC transporter ATP-binding protein [Candidatus Sericytochromatia bacterium]
MTGRSGEALRVTGLSAGYPGHPVLRDVGFTLARGTLTGVLGPNGAGKSTLLKAVLGLLPHTGGEVRVLGGALATVRRQVAYVPQRSAVDWDFPATVRDVVLMGRLGHCPWWSPWRQADLAAVDAALTRVELADLAARRIGDLSGGQQQRVFLARALAQEAELYLLDEPFAGVDAASEALILQQLQAIRDAGGAVVVVHHDLHTARQAFDHLLLLNRRVVACGPTAEVFTPAALQAAYDGRLLVFETGAGPSEPAFGRSG